MVAPRRPPPTATRLRVVITCSKRKKAPIPAPLRLRSITAVRTATRLREWTARLNDVPAPTMPAVDLYAGEHWDVARRLVEVCPIPAELWVCSAGYGLMPADTPIKPYAATFASGTPDSVPSPVTDWWAALNGWQGPTRGVRSITDLLAADRSVRVLLVLSAGYVVACRHDLARTIDQLDDARQLSVISAGTKAEGWLSRFLLPADARLQSALGGTRQALNAHIAERLLSAGVTEHAEMSDALERLLADQPALVRYAREPATDTEVRAFIHERLRRDPHATQTRLLREYRDANHACEQSRFAALFRDEKGT